MMTYGTATRHGFTLVELMVALALSLFLMGGATLMYLSVQSTYDDTNRLSRLQENVRFASDYLVRDVRNAGFTDQIALTIGEENAIRSQFARLESSGTELVVRYSGRGHCQRPFDEYVAVENRYFVDGGELLCEGQLIDSEGNVVPDEGGTVALVGGMTDAAFELRMADGSSVSGTDYTCDDTDIEAELGDRCLGVLIGLEFEALRNPDVPGTLDRRFVELWATFRNPAIGHIFSDLYDDDDEDD